VSPRAFHFVLKNSFEYRVHIRGRVVNLVKGQVFSTADVHEVQLLRAKNDVIAECDAAGVIFGAAAPGAINTSKAKSYQRYGDNGRSRQQQRPAPAPKLVQVGKVADAHAQADVAQARVPAPVPAPAPAAVSAPAVSTPTGHVAVPPPPPIPSADRKSRRGEHKVLDKVLDAQAAERMSPLEEVGKDGTTVAKQSVSRA
jgi:hypothetical protein